MRAFVLSIAVVLAATPLSGDIAWQTGRMAPGSVMVMAEQGGPVLSHVAQGRDGGLFRFDTYEGKGTAPVYHGSYYTNDRGEVVRSVTAEGQVTEYEPHRCARTRRLVGLLPIVRGPDAESLVRHRPLPPLVGTPSLDDVALRH